MADGSDGSARLAVVTGASSGIGAATARLLAEEGYDVLIGARRVERLEALADEIGPRAEARPLDVSSPASVAEFCGGLERLDVLVNNAGGALGTEPVESADEEKWVTMYQSNVMGTLRMTKSLLPALIASGSGTVVNVGSVAAFEPYPGGAGYNAAKHALRALNDVLRMEMLGRPVRICEIDPGMVETEFSLVRYGGDEEAAGAVYRGVTPLTAEDVAACIAFMVTRPPHVDVDRMVVRPRDQARAHLVHRDSSAR
jgi:NADP-dependent 3-hydroxy acid dehydrogenase YdfG